MNLLTLQNLPNEILRQILSNISPLDLRRGWWDINSRFNGLILSVKHKISLKDKNIANDELQAILFFRNQVVSLVVTKIWCKLINQFINLRSLRILGFDHLFSKLQITVKILPQLTHLYMMIEFDWDNFMTADNGHYARQIVCCHMLKLIKTPNVSCTTLRSVKFVQCTSEALAAIMRLAPNLIHMDIGLFTPFTLDLTRLQFVSISTTTEEDQHPAFVPTPTNYFENLCHTNLRRLRLNFACETTLKWLDKFLDCTPNIMQFTLEIGRSYEVFSFVELHRIITKHFPNLMQRNFRLQYCCLPMKFNLDEHRSIGPLFKSMIAEEKKSGPMTLFYVSVNWPKNKYYRNNN